MCTTRNDNLTTQARRTVRECTGANRHVMLALGAPAPPNLSLRRFGCAEGASAAGAPPGSVGGAVAAGGAGAVSNPTVTCALQTASVGRRQRQSARSRRKETHIAPRAVDAVLLLDLSPTLFLLFIQCAALPCALGADHHRVVVFCLDGCSSVVFGFFVVIVVVVREEVVVRGDEVRIVRVVDLVEDEAGCTVEGGRLGSFREGGDARRGGERYALNLVLQCLHLCLLLGKLDLEVFADLRRTERGANEYVERVARIPQKDRRPRIT